MGKGEKQSVHHDLRSVLLGAGAVALGCMPEVVLRHGGSLSLGILLSLILGGSVGAVLSALMLSVRNTRIAAALLLLPAPLIQYSTIVDAAVRMSEINPNVILAGIWSVLLCLAALVSTLFFLWLRKRKISSWMRVFLAVCAGGFTVVIAILPVQELGGTLGMVVPCLVVAGCFALAILGWRRRIVLGFFVLVSLAVSYTLPSRYIELLSIAGFTFASSAVLMICTWSARDSEFRFPSMKLGMVCAVSLGLLYGAHFLISRHSESWASSRGSGILSVLVETGHRLTDFDGDGISAIFAQRDCHPFDSSAYPGAYEIPGNEVDENCLGGPVRGDTAAWIRAREAINSPPTPTSADIVLVVIDTLRADDARERSLGALSDLRSRSIDFNNAHSSSSFTSFSLQSLLGGRIPGALEMEWQGRISASPVLVPSSLASFLRDMAGYDTALAGGARLDQNRYFQENTFGHGFRITERLRMDARPEEITSAAIRAWKGLDDTKPRFLYVHIMWLHQEQPDRASYRRSLREVDSVLGNLVQSVGQDAIWVLTSDHGDEFGEHGGRHHASSLYVEQVQVPLLMAIPGQLPRRETHVSPLRSLLPTLVALVAPTHIPSGLGPYLCIDQDSCSDIPVPMALPMQDLSLHGLLLGDRKIIRDNRRGTLESFDLSVDPSEGNPLRGSEIPSDLRRELLEWEENAFGPRSESHVWPYTGQLPIGE